MRIRNLLMLAIAVLVMASCNDDDDVINRSLVDVQANMPKSLKNPKLKSAIFTFENVNTGEKIEKEANYIPQTFFDVEDGMYNVSVKGEVTYLVKTSEDKMVERTETVRALQQNVEVVGGNLVLKLEFAVVPKASGFVISEIFYTGTNTTEGKAYFGGDQFIEIYNNSDKTLYADGLCIASTTVNVQTTQKYELVPDFRSEGVVVDAVYQIPGSGKEHAVKPGETMLFCNVAINHNAKNTNSFDLSKANYEWFDGTKTDDVDVPEVPNLVKLIAGDFNWQLNVKGNNSYILFRAKSNIKPDDFLKEHAFSYVYKFYGMDVPLNEWKINNADVIDAVQCSVVSDFQWNIFSSDLDITYTFCDASYSRKSVKRKVIGMDGDRKILQDTNDSANDFIPNAEPTPGVIEDYKK